MTPLLQVKDLQMVYNAGSSKEVIAVDQVSFDVQEGETFGLVGESGSGKSTLGRAVVRLLTPASGQILYKGKAIDQLKTRQERLAYHKDVQMISQDPYASLNPRMKVEDIIAEGIDIHGLASSKKERRQKVVELLKAVGLNEEHAGRYPHEFSGGQRQRIGIARALAVEPRLIVADEPISALDVSIQAQIINLLEDLQKERGLTYLFIAHDLSMVKYFSDRIAMLHQGRVVELASSEDLYAHPQHPYTQSLLSAIPTPDPDFERERRRLIYQGDEPKAGEWVEVRPDHYVYR